MTLDTRIYILDQTDPHAVFAACQRILAAYDNQERPSDRQTFTDKPAGWPHTDPDRWVISNDSGQGLPVWLMVYYRPDAPLRTAEDEAVHDEEICTQPDSEWYSGDPEDLCSGRHPYQTACWVEISFDTAYVAVSKGLRCNELHVQLIKDLGLWLGDQGLRWKWKNEYRNEVFDGFDGLTTLISSGDQANAWFDLEVLPVITAYTAREAAKEN